MPSRCEATLVMPRWRGGQARCEKELGHEHLAGLAGSADMHRCRRPGRGCVQWADTAAGATPSTATTGRAGVAEAAR